MNFTDQFNRALEIKKLNINKLAKKLNLHNGNLYQIRRGEKSPSLEMLNRIITEGFGMSFAEFFAEDDPHFDKLSDKYTKEEIEIYKKINRDLTRLLD